MIPLLTPYLGTLFRVLFFDFEFLFETDYI